MLVILNENIQIGIEGFPRLLLDVDTIHIQYVSQYESEKFPFSTQPPPPTSQEKKQQFNKSIIGNRRQDAEKVEKVKIDAIDASKRAGRRE